ncbi:hypothetical protein BGZ67_007260 [Mortierella alpina]|nr:hypothetical protein BGZ67_007260 [Mortierella alpina]
MKVTAILSALAAATLVSAGTFHDFSKLDKVKTLPRGFIIEYHDNIKANEAHNALNSRKVDYKIRNEYNIFNGAAITVNSKHDGKDIAKIPGVKNVWPIKLYSIPKLQKNTKQPDFAATSLHRMTGVDVVHKEYKLTGKGIKVTFGAYRVFGCDGSSADDVILAAMELAFNDGMDIINMSLGGGSAYKSDPTAVLAEKLIARGMALSASAGNSGDEGAWMVGNTGLGDHATSNASFDNVWVYLYSMVYGKNAPIPYTFSTGYGKVISLPATATLVPLLEKDGTLSDGCDQAVYDGKDVKGKVVLVLGNVTRCKSGGRGALGQKNGAAGMITQTDGGGLANLGGVPGFPMASIENLAGAQLLAAYKADPKATFTWVTKQNPFNLDNNGAPSTFSSLGLDGDLRSKPDIGAPGGNILSTYPLAEGGYAVLSGTSMSSPYTAGSHALYMQAKKSKVRGDLIRQALKNTATISKSYKSKTFASAAKQGAGLINVLNAIRTTTAISPDHIDLLDTINLQKTVKISIKNSGKKTETYTLSHVPADTLNLYKVGTTFPLGHPGVEASYASVVFSSSKVKIPAGKSATITLRFKEPKSAKANQFPLYSGYVVAKPASKNGIAVNVPYTGLKGDVRNVPIMDTDSGFPALATRSADGTLGPVPKGNSTFDLKTSMPVVLTRLGSHTPDATIRVFDASNKFVGYMSSLESGPAFGPAGRVTNVNSKTGKLSVATFTWVGEVLPTKNTTVTPTKLPAGSYSVVVASQKKFSKVNLHSRVAERNRLQLAQGDQRGQQKLEQEQVPNQVDHEYDFGTWKGYAGQFSSEFVKELETHDDVEYVEEDTLMWAWGVDQDNGAALDTQEGSAALDANQEALVPEATSSTDTSEFDTNAVVNGHNVNLEYFSLKAPSWGLARIAERERDLAKDYSYMSSAGADVDVYIIDSGVYAEHSDFGGRAFNLANFVSSERDTDTCGHVAGRRYGVAKAARIQAIKVLDAEGQGSTSQVMAGINFMIKHASNNPNPKKVINMSLGGQVSRPVNDAVRVAVTQYKLPFFVAAGNTGDDACQYSPAGVKEAFSVGGSDRSDRVGWYSCTGQCVNIFAPGSGITSDWIRSPSSAHILDGTSMAAPHVAGVAALFLGAGNTYSSAQGLYDDLVRMSTKGIISGVMSNEAQTTKNLLYNKLEDIGATFSVHPQDDIVALEEGQATDAKVNARKKAKKMRDENDRNAGRHHHHH